MSILHWLASMRAAFVIGVTILVFLGVRILDYWDSLRWAQTDNYSWSISQLEVELLKLQVSILAAERAPDDPARLDRVRIYEVGISYYGRTYEEGKKIGWRDGFRAIYCILKYNLFNK